MKQGFAEIGKKAAGQGGALFTRKIPCCLEFHVRNSRPALGGGWRRRKLSPQRFRCCWSKRRSPCRESSLRRRETEITLAPEELRAQEQITQAFAKAGLAVPSVKEVLAQLKIETARAEKLLQILLRGKVLVRVFGRPDFSS